MFHVLQLADHAMQSLRPFTVRCAALCCWAGIAAIAPAGDYELTNNDEQIRLSTPTLEAAIKTKVGQAEKWSLRLDDEDPDQQTLLFEYPTSFPPDATGYIRRTVKIEIENAQTN